MAAKSCARGTALLPVFLLTLCVLIIAPSSPDADPLIADCDLVFVSSDDFGVVEVGWFRDRTIYAINTGDEVIGGDATLSCADFSILSGGGPFTLDPGDTLEIVARFAPVSVGPTGCTLYMNGTCPHWYLYGSGAELPTPDVTENVISLHVTSVGGSSPDTPCIEHVVQRPVGMAAYVWLVAARAPGYLHGISCGILYDNGATGATTMSNGSGVDVYSWTNLYLDIPNGPSDDPSDMWPASGGGNTIRYRFWDPIDELWETRWTNNVAADGNYQVCGYFYVGAYSPDEFQVIPNRNKPEGPELLVWEVTTFPAQIPYPDHAAVAGFGSGTGYNPCDTTTATTSVPPGLVPPGLTLHQASPNPFLTSTRIAFRTGADGPALVRVFDIAGREVARPFTGDLPAGEHVVPWDGRSDTGARLSAGIYLYRVETAEGAGSGKVVLMN